MLLKTNITKVDMWNESKNGKESYFKHPDEWYAARLAKFTSSKKSLLMGETGLGDTGMNYIRTRVGEELTGITSEKEVDTEGTRWGILYEMDAIKKFIAHFKIEFAVTQRAVTEPGSRFASTPDVIWIHNESIDKLAYNVSVGEVKCYPSYDHYISVATCNTPEDLKKADKVLFWQLLDQMDKCDALNGYAVFYHPDFKVGGFKIIEFRKVLLMKYLTLLKKRDELAVQKFGELRNELFNLQNPKINENNIS